MSRRAEPSGARVLWLLVAIALAACGARDEWGFEGDFCGPGYPVCLRSLVCVADDQGIRRCVRPEAIIDANPAGLQDAFRGSP